jgi:hypothetical protein
MLESLGINLRDDPEVVLTVMRQTKAGWNFKHASDRLKSDGAFVIKVVQKLPSVTSAALGLLKCVESSKLKDDPGIMLAVL